MSPTEWQAWNFGVILTFALLGIGIAIGNIAVAITAGIILIFLYRYHAKQKDTKIAVPTW